MFISEIINISDSVLVSDHIIAVVDVNHFRSDMDCFEPLMEKLKSTYGFYPKYPTAGAGYGSYNNYIYCQEHSIEKFMFKKETTDQKYRNNPFRAVNFKIDDEGFLRCPNDKKTFFSYRKPVRNNNFLGKNIIAFITIINYSDSKIIK